MRRRRTRPVLIAVAMTVAVAGVTAGASGLAANAATHDTAAHRGELSSGAPVTVVASGLSGPRDMVWGPHGHMLVAEAGIPPTACHGTNPVTMVCWGTTGLISDVSSGKPVPIVKGLASAFNEAEVVGPDSLTYTHGHLYTLETAAPQEIPPGLPAGLTAVLKKEFGALLSITNGKISVVADPGNADYLWSGKHVSLAPHDFPDADPYALIAQRGGGFYLVDAASNTLDSVDRRGHVHVLAFVPNTPAGTDAAPTCLAQAPDGSVYLGEITGHGNSGTAANVYRYVPWRHKLTVWQRGFSAINGCGFGANGDFYVTELDTTGFLPTSGTLDGAVIQISHNGTRTVLGHGKLFAPAGFLAGRDGSIYVANNCLIWPAGVASSPASNGQIVKIG